MTFRERIRALDWWWWTVSLALLVVGLAGWYTALFLLVLVSAFHAVVFILRDKMHSVSAQVRVV